MAKRDFLGSMNDIGIFLGREKTQGLFWGLFWVLDFSSAQINKLLTIIQQFTARVGFFVYAKKVGNFLGICLKQILKLGLFWV